MCEIPNIIFLVEINGMFRRRVAEFKLYFDYVRSLRFDDRPDYDYLKRLFRELFFKREFRYDNMFDWDLLAQRSQRTRSVDDVQEGAMKVGEGVQGGGEGEGAGDVAEGDDGEEGDGRTGGADGKSKRSITREQAESEE